MKDEIVALLKELGSHPIMFGALAGLARWRMGDRAGGLQVFLTQIIVSCFVAFVAAQYLGNGNLTDGKEVAYVCLLAFAAKDLLMAVVLLGAQFAKDPLGVWEKLKSAFFRGGAK